MLETLNRDILVNPLYYRKTIHLKLRKFFQSILNKKILKVLSLHNRMASVKAALLVICCWYAVRYAQTKRNEEQMVARTDKQTRALFYSYVRSLL